MKTEDLASSVVKLVNEAFAWALANPVVTALILVGLAFALAAISASRQRPQARTMQLVVGGPPRVMGVRFDEIGSTSFGHRPLDPNFPTVVWLVNEHGKPLGRGVRMRLRSKRGSFPANSVEFDEDDLYQMGLARAGEWHKEVRVLARNVSQWSPPALWFHPDPQSRLSFRLSVFFAIIALATDKGWDFVVSCWQGRCW
jgi:hypothetical protein